MTYRKLSLNSTTYEYVVGKSHTKVKGVGVFLNSDIGQQFDVMCHCGCGMTLSEAYGSKGSGDGYKQVGVTPADVKTAIVKKMYS